MEVYASNDTGVFRITVLPGEDPELDKLTKAEESLCANYVDAVSHILKQYGQVK